MVRAVLILLLCGHVSSVCLSQSPASAPTASSPAAELSAANSKPTYTRSLVYRIENPEAIADYDPNIRVVRKMIDQLVMAVTGTGDVGSAWATMVKPTDIVGIKVCANGAPLFSTHPAVVDGIIAGLHRAGIPSENIIVWDREQELLERAGFRKSSGTYRLMWSAGNYDPHATLTSPIAGKLIYGDLLFGEKLQIATRADSKADPKDKHNRKDQSDDGLSDESHISNVLTRVVTKVINVPVLSDHIYCGLSGALYNMVIQNLDNWRRLVQEPDCGDPAIPESYADPRIGGKVVIHLMDGLIGLYAGAPIGDANYAVHFGTLYASKDPVALDAIAVRQIDQWRIEAKMNPASKAAKYIDAGSAYGLGNADLNKIELRDVR